MCSTASLMIVDVNAVFWGISISQSLVNQSFLACYQKLTQSRLVYRTKKDNGKTKTESH